MAKRLAIGLLAGIILLGGFTAWSAADAPIQLVVDGRAILFPVAPPQILNDRVMVPARPLAEALGAKVEWDDAARAVRITSLIGSAANSTPRLTDAELALMRATTVPELFLQEVKASGQNLRQLEGINAEGESTKAAGVTIDVSKEKAPALVRKLREAAPSGWLPFISAMNFGINGDPDQVSVLKASSLTDVIMVMGTGGWNYDRPPEKVATRIQEWDRRYGLVLEGASFDWFLATFKNPPPDMLVFAAEVYEFCPDVVDQGAETVEALADEMKQENAVYLWWD